VPSGGGGGGRDWGNVEGVGGGVGIPASKKTRRKRRLENRAKKTKNTEMNKGVIRAVSAEGGHTSGAKILTRKI